MSRYLVGILFCLVIALSYAAFRDEAFQDLRHRKIRKRDIRQKQKGALNFWFYTELEKEYGLYNLVETLAPQIIASERKMYKGVSINVDFYSGFVYDMLGLPHELYTPLFAIARIAGWGAHRIEELLNAGKIIRPAYMNVHPRRDYVKIGNR